MLEVAYSPPAITSGRKRTGLPRRESPPKTWCPRRQTDQALARYVIDYASSAVNRMNSQFRRCDCKSDESADVAGVSGEVSHEARHLPDSTVRCSSSCRS